MNQRQLDQFLPSKSTRAQAEDTVPVSFFSALSMSAPSNDDLVDEGTPHRPKTSKHRNAGVGAPNKPNS